MTVRLPKTLRGALWPHQREAIEAMSRYIAGFDRRTPRAALVHMPTGSGKTAVIASLARCIEGKGPVVVVTPRVGLRRQLARDIEKRFFEHAGVDASSLPRRVLELHDGRTRPSELDDLIVVATVQLLSSLRARGRALYDDLQRASLVLFDEGHYEPAPTWSYVIRAFPCPRIVFSATPFRDDFKLFDIDPASSFRYSFARACKEHYIRNVTFHPRSPIHSPSDFAQAVVADYGRLFKGAADGVRAPRVIIRCDRPHEIRQIADALRKLGQTVVAIHETFDEQPDRGEYHTVPDPDVSTAHYWVHQFKLLEGIDDARFQLVALYRELRSVRSLVQQVGRVIRNPARARSSVAHVLDHSDGLQQTLLWKTFLAYDQLVEQRDPAALELGTSSLAATLQKSVPGIVYQEGRLRTPAVVEGLELGDIRLPLSVNVHDKPAGFSLADAQVRMVRRGAEEDLFVHAPPLRSDTAAVFFVRVSGSPFLRNGFFAEPQLGLSVIHVRGTYVFTFDSSTRLAAGATDAIPVSAAKLRKLYVSASGTRLTVITTINANIGSDQVRSRSIGAARVERLAPSFDEHGYVLRTATGYSKGRRGRGSGDERTVRRYIGIENGRVCDLGSGFVSYDDWTSWTAELTRVLDARTQPLQVFRRWASDAHVPANPSPRNVLLDLGDVVDHFRTTGADGLPRGEPMEPSDLCADVKAGRFAVTMNGRSCAVDIGFDAARARYELKSPDLDRRYESDVEKDGVVRYLNRAQSLRVIPETRGQFYTLGQFYRPLIGFGPDYDDAKVGVLSSLVAISELGHPMREKGERCSPDGSGWQAGSLFHLIDTLGKGTKLEEWLANSEVLVCDDLDDENADFIVVQGATRSRRRRVVAIHAKASIKKSLCSASDLHDVCGQAQKNLRDFSLFSDPPRNKTQKWNKPWKGGAHTSGTVHRRIRRQAKGSDPEEDIWRTVKDPAADREVWIVLGNLLSRSEFDKLLHLASPPPHAIQAAYLLHSTISNVAAAGARLTVFCAK